MPASALEDACRACAEHDRGAHGVGDPRQRVHARDRLRRLEHQRAGEERRRHEEHHEDEREVPCTTLVLPLLSASAAPERRRTRWRRGPRAGSTAARPARRRRSARRRSARLTTNHTAARAPITPVAAKRPEHDRGARDGRREEPVAEARLEVERQRGAAADPGEQQRTAASPPAAGSRGSRAPPGSRAARWRDPAPPVLDRQQQRREDRGAGRGTAAAGRPA